MIRHTLTPLPSGDFLLKMYESDQTPSNVVEPFRGRCLQTTDVTKEDAAAMAMSLLDHGALKLDFWNPKLTHQQTPSDEAAVTEQCVT